MDPGPASPYCCFIARIALISLLAKQIMVVPKAPARTTCPLRSIWSFLGSCSRRTRWFVLQITFFWRWGRQGKSRASPQAATAFPAASSGSSGVLLSLRAVFATRTYLEAIYLASRGLQDSLAHYRTESAMDIAFGRQDSVHWKRDERRPLPVFREAGEKEEAQRIFSVWHSLENVCGLGMLLGVLLTLIVCR